MTHPRYIGVLEKQISHGIRGWVIDRTNPNAQPEVILRFDDRYSVILETNIPRRNLWQGMEGNYGFELPISKIPESLLATLPKKIHATVRQEDFALSNSPISFNANEVARAICMLVSTDLKNNFY